MRAQVLRGAAAVALIVPFSLSAQATMDAQARALLGLEVSLSGTGRDTLGVVVSGVVAGSPAERGGIQQRDRIAEVNGMSLRVSREDVGRPEAQEIVSRRLARELGALRPGDAVSMRVYTGTRVRTVNLRVDEPREAPKSVVREGAAPTLQTTIEGLRVTQSQLRALAAQERSSSVRDSLTQAETEIAELVRRLQATEARQRRGADEAPAGESTRGLRINTITPELEAYFGEGTAGSLLVLEADQSWAPIRAGDVIVRIDGQPATQAALLAARDSRDATEVEILRKKRSIIVSFEGRR
jgi:S1-C subfamily serine protease